MSAVTTSSSDVQESCWVYLTPDVVPESRERPYEEQKKLANAFGGEVPDLADAVTGIFMKFLCSGKRIFGIKP